MASFSGKIENAYYFDADFKIIEIITAEEDGTHGSHILEVNPKHPDYKEFLAEGWNKEKLIETTAENKRSQAQIFDAWVGEMVNTKAQALAEEMMGLRYLMDQKKALEDQALSLKKDTAKLENAKKDKEKTLLSLDQDVKIKTNKVDHALFDYIYTNNETAEELFKFKLWALEQDQVKEADKKIKSAIRKSKRITSAIAIFDSLL